MLLLRLFCVVSRPKRTVRFPCVVERVGGQSDDWDREKFDLWDLDLKCPLVFIVQVKTGDLKNVSNSFQHKRLRMALERTGLFSPEVIEAKLPALKLGPCVRFDCGTVAAKLLISPRGTGQGGKWFQLPLEDVITSLRSA